MLTKLVPDLFSQNPILPSLEMQQLTIQKFLQHRRLQEFIMAALPDRKVDFAKFEEDSIVQILVQVVVAD